MSSYKRFTVDDDEELNEMGVSNAPTSITPAQQVVYNENIFIYFRNDEDYFLYR